jgi:2-methylisocitrate lyase-like PEP mutase family enzyme
VQFRGPGDRRRGPPSPRGAGGEDPRRPRRHGPDFFINARTDIFLKAKAETHDEAKVEAALERARAYAEAGASGFFAPGLADLALLERLCAASPLPVNFMAFPGAPGAGQVAAAGVARISHGPFPYRLAMEALKAAAEEAYG